MIEESQKLKNFSYSKNEYKYTVISTKIEDLNEIVNSIEEKDLISFFIENNSEV